MPQTLYHASGLTADNADKLKDAGMNVPGVKWVNINNGNVVVTHEDGFDAVAAVVAENSFARAVARRFVGNDGREAQFGDVLQLFAQRFAEVGHRVKIGDALVINPFQQLLGAEGFFAHLREVFGECV